MKITKLSVNINKIATLRNSRGGDFPNVLQFAKDIEEFGANGITVHPRPDERHIRYQDVFELKKNIKTEFNIEGNPIPKFIDLVLANKPAQVTLVPDAIDAITSNAGWDALKNQSFLKEVISEFKNNGIRTSLFMETHLSQIEAAASTGADRIELYTETYSKAAKKNDLSSIEEYVASAELAKKLGMGVNAGHDLNLENIEFFAQKIPSLDEVSIGHALIVESLYYGLQNVINMYLHKLEKAAITHANTSLNH